MVKNFNIFKLIILLILGIGIVARFYQLDYRPLHHDESLHTFYAQQQAISFTTKFYKYNPMLHGPTLYDITALFIKIWGNSKYIWRTPSAIAGVLISILLVILLLKEQNNKIKIISLLLIATLSPQLIYWSRFLRNDIILIFFHLWLFYILFYTNIKHRALLIPIIISLQFTLKENTFLTIFQLSLLYIVYLCFHPFHIKKIKISWPYLLSGLTIAIIIYCTIYSAAFLYPSGIIDGLYRKSIVYWFHQHQTARITGPFIFQTTILLWYSPILFLTALFTIIHLLSKLPLHFKYLSSTIYLLLFCTLLIPPIPPFQLSADLYFFLLYIILALAIPLIFLFQQEYKLFFLSGMFLSSLLIYSFVGEKVPWLALYPYLYMLLFIFYYWKNINLGTSFYIWLITLITSQIVINLKINYQNSPTEPIHQVASTPEFENIIQSLQHQTTPFLLKGEIIWPAHPFLQGNRNYYFSANDHTNLNKFSTILLDTRYKNRWNKKLQPYFMSSQKYFRRYWWPKNTDYTWNKIISFLFYRVPTSTLSEQPFYIYNKR